jgi:hypothetical protein
VEFVKATGTAKITKQYTKFEKLLDRGYHIIFPPKHFVRPSCVAAKKLYGCRPINVIEVGSNWGYNARAMLDYLNINQIFLVDPYELYYESERGANFKEDAEAVRKRAEKYLKKYNNVYFIRKKSQDAGNDFCNGAFDYIYIDGDHNYNMVLKDLYTYWDKVAPGGILGGHDYSANFLQVCYAVNEFARDMTLELNGCHEDWWFYKDE